MEYVDLVSKIVAAEHSAQDIAREAQEKQESLDADLKRDVTQLREDCMGRARHRIAMVEETEQAAAREDMAAWDKKLAKAMDDVESTYARNKDAWVDLLFHKVVGE